MVVGGVPLVSQAAPGCFPVSEVQEMCRAFCNAELVTEQAQQCTRMLRQLPQADEGSKQKAKFSNQVTNSGA